MMSTSGQGSETADTQRQISPLKTEITLCMAGRAAMMRVCGEVASSGRTALKRSSLYLLFFHHSNKSALKKVCLGLLCEVRPVLEGKTGP